MRLAPDQALTVWLRGQKADQRVGRLAWRDRRAWFQFDQAFIATGLELSPMRLRLQPGVVEAPTQPFGGLFGLFDDSLPDGWGRLLLDRHATARGIAPATLTPLDRLAAVGRTGLGALAYEPDLGEGAQPGPVALDVVAAGAQRVLAGEADEVLPALLRLGGSPQGARPKVLVWLRPSDQHVASGDLRPSPEHQRVLVKFRAAVDAADAGAIEFAYHALAIRAGINVPAAWCLSSEVGMGWFAVARFDRTPDDVPLHLHTFCGLLHAHHRLPSLDYVGAHAVVHRLTGDMRSVTQLFRRMVFNVVAHNRDDHTKQQSLLLRPDGSWSLAPAYDLTCAAGPGGEHSMAVAGSGDPDRKAVLAVAKQVGIAASVAHEIIDEVQTAVIDGWPAVAPSAAARHHVGALLRPLH